MNNNQEQETSVRETFRQLKSKTAIQNVVNPKLKNGSGQFSNTQFLEAFKRNLEKMFPNKPLK